MPILYKDTLYTPKKVNTLNLVWEALYGATYINPLRCHINEPSGCPINPFLPPWCLPACPLGAFLPPWCLPGASQAVQLVLSCLPGASQSVQLILSCHPGASQTVQLALVPPIGPFLPPWCLPGCPIGPFLPPWCLPGCPIGAFLPPWCLPGASFPASQAVRLSTWCFPVSLVPPRLFSCLPGRLLESVSLALADYWSHPVVGI